MAAHRFAMVRCGHTHRGARACVSYLLIAASSTLEISDETAKSRVSAAGSGGDILSPDRCVSGEHGPSVAVKRRLTGPELPLDARRPAPYPLVPPASSEFGPDERQVLEQTRARQAALADAGPQRGGGWIEAAVRTQLRNWFARGSWYVARWTAELSARYPAAYVLRIERGVVHRLYDGLPGYRRHRLVAYLTLFADVARLDPELNVTFVAFPQDGCPGNARPQPEASGTSCPLVCEKSSHRARPAGNESTLRSSTCARAPRRATCKCGKYVAQPSSMSVRPGLEPTRLPVPVLCFQKDVQNHEAALIPELELLMGRGRWSKRKMMSRRSRRSSASSRRLRVHRHVPPRSLHDARGALLSHSYEYRSNISAQDDLPWAEKRGGVAYFAGTPSGLHHGMLNQRLRVCLAHQLLAKPSPSGVPSAEAVGGGTANASSHAFIEPLAHPSGLRCRLVLPACPSSPDVQLGECADGSALATSVRGSWGEALEHRYVLSMDGNGATCSRVYLALRSRSVLLKLEAAPPLALQSTLYFHTALRAWEHFVPVTEGNIAQTVAWLDAHEDVAQDIAEAGRAFAEQEYTYDVAVWYAHFLLHALAQLHRREHRHHVLATLPADVRRTAFFTAD